MLPWLPAPVEEDPLGAVAHWARMFADPGRTWDDLALIRAHWDGPIVVKGVLHPDDARLAYDAGMDGHFDGSVGENVEKVYRDLEAKRY